jgi:hypothetical protein
VTVAGRNFGQPFGKRLVLGGGGAYTDLVVMSWSDAAIVAHVPGDARVFVNQDEIVHSLYSMTPGHEFRLGEQPPGQVRRVLLDAPGEFAVFTG